MKLNVAVTLFVSTVIFLANSVWAAENSTTVTNSKVVNTTPSPVPIAPPTTYNVAASITRSTSLVDFKDGSRSDGLDYVLQPSIRFSSGRAVTAQISFTQNLRDEYTNTENGLNDIPISLSLKPTKLYLAKNWDSKISYALTGVIPVSELSTKRDQLNTSISSKIGFSMVHDKGFSFSTSISAGRNFHSYEEDINGNVLNQYSSNQTLLIGYEIKGWSFSTEFINRSRWTYQNSSKSAFEMTEEIGYGFNDYISVALGHTNGGSTLKANGTDSNIDIFNENNSTVYGTLGLTY